MPSRMNETWPKGGRPGWSLIELLVALSIITLLLAMMMAGLRAARERARDGLSAGYLRAHAQAMTVYTNDHRAFYPYFTEPGFLSKKLTGGGTERWVSYFDAHRTWHIALADDYYQGTVRDPSFFPPQYREDGGGFWPVETGYHYACAFIADPAYWNPYTRMGPSQYRATRISEVRFPSLKALLVESWPFVERVGEPGGMRKYPLPAAMCDGSARALTMNEQRNGYERGDGVQFDRDGAVHFTDWPRLLHAIDGVRGRDVR